LNRSGKKKFRKRSTIKMISKLRNRIESEKGFTLIELLVVILIIGILAAIAIPSFLNQREKGQDACAKSMARTMQTAMETYYIDNNTYATATKALLSGVENQITDGSCGANSQNFVGTTTGAAGACATAAPAVNGYCVGSQSAAGSTGAGTGRQFVIDRSAAGVITRRCGASAGGSGATGNGGACAGGTW
jgi:type IV pilus assembly protein PilA